MESPLENIQCAMMRVWKVVVGDVVSLRRPLKSFPEVSKPIPILNEGIMRRALS
ncbi:hypothetical protein COLO4_08599 [Corchorus olitorius]|uniref:Uncharacterized protein n=1 Tax=Corchorus olitorius TaxID=93759 RepID=A0A1R3KF54_9ROSI|nr:hypothetical protein COLO4_08599 [Corchorus olitorius]